MVDERGRPMIRGDHWLPNADSRLEAVRSDGSALAISWQ